MRKSIDHLSYKFVHVHEPPPSPQKKLPKNFNLTAKVTLQAININVTG